MTKSVASALYCRSSGSVVFESDIASFSVMVTVGQQYADAQVFVRPSDERVLPPTGERWIPAAPFENPGVVALDNQASQPVQPRKTIFIHDLGDRRLALEAAIPVALDFWPGSSVTACCYDLEDFGAGQDEFSALADLKESLVDLYFLLKNDADRLGPLPQRHWDYLQSIITER